MAGARIEVEVIDLLELSDLLQAGVAERSLPFEHVQHDSLEQVAEAHVVVLGQAFQDLEDALLDAHAGLDALDFVPCQPWY